MAVAPINKVRQILDYAVTEIPPYKINLGIPTYGYDWPLPYIKGKTKAITIGCTDAILIALENNAQIQFDPIAMSPFFEYTRDGTDHIVWFEDVRSIDAKLRLVPEYGFMGCGYWNVMKYFRGNWLLLNSLFQLTRP